MCVCVHAYLCLQTHTHTPPFLPPPFPSADVDPLSCVRVLRLLAPKLEHQIDLVKKVDIIQTLKVRHNIFRYKDSTTVCLSVCVCLCVSVCVCPCVDLCLCACLTLQTCARVRRVACVCRNWRHRRVGEIRCQRNTKTFSVWEKHDRRHHICS